MSNKWDEESKHHAAIAIVLAVCVVSLIVMGV